MERIHGIYPDGRFVVDIAAFKAFYELVGLGWVYKVTEVEFVNKALNAVYGVWAKVGVDLDDVRSLFARADSLFARADSLFARADSLVRCADSLVRCADSLVRCADSLVRCADSLVRCADSLVLRASLVLAVPAGGHRQARPRDHSRREEDVRERPGGTEVTYFVRFIPSLFD